MLAKCSGNLKEEVLGYEGPNWVAKDIRVQYAGKLITGRSFRDFEFVPDRAANGAREWIQYARRAGGGDRIAQRCATAPDRRTDVSKRQDHDWTVFSFRVDVGRPYPADLFAKVSCKRRRSRCYCDSR